MANRESTHDCQVSLAMLFALVWAFMTFGQNVSVVNARGMQPAGDWSSWRGGDLQGRSALDTPVHWSADQNIRWSASVPGMGNSSPIVKGGLVVLSTAYLSSGNARLQNGISVLILILVGSGLALGGFIAMQGSSRLSSLRHNIYVGCLASALMLWAFLLIFGSALFDFQRCEIRAWVAGCSTLTLSLLIAQGAYSTKSLLRMVLSVCVLALSIIFVIAMPSKDHAFRGGWSGASALVVLSVAMFPLCTGFFAIFRCVQSQFAVDYSRYQRLVGSIVVGIALVGAVFGVRIINAATETTSAHAGSHTATSTSTVAWLLLAIVWGIQLFILTQTSYLPACAGKTPGRLEFRRIATLVVYLVMLGTFSCLCFLVLAGSGGYLSYHLAGAKLSPLLGWRAFLILTASVVISLAALAAAGKRLRGTAIASRVMCACVIAAGLLSLSANSLIKSDLALTRAIVAYDGATGQQKWTCEGLRAPEHVLHRLNSPATPTPVAANGFIFAHFGAAGIMCADHFGKLVWTNEEITFQSIYGAGSSLAASDGVLVAVSGMPENAYIAGLECSSGKILWRRPMQGSATSGNSRTPVILRLDGKTTIIVWGFDGLSGLDITTGRELWNYGIGGGGGDQVATLVYDDQCLYCLGAAQSTALRIDSLGRDADEPIVWQRKFNAANCATPVVANGTAFCVSDSGVVSCIELKTGKIVHRRRLSGGFYSSPVVAGEHVYFTSVDGKTTVCKAKAELEFVAQNELPGSILASPAICDGQLLFRSGEELYCIGEDLETKPIVAVSR